jgi:acetyl-CoA acyltransferase
MSAIPFAAEEDNWQRLGTPWPQPLLDHHELVPQGVSAERVAQKWEIGRAEMDATSLRSHQRAARARVDGRFDAEVIAVSATGGPITSDQGIRPDTNLESLAALRPAFDPTGSVTAGNASQISDGACALLLASREHAEALNLPIMARVVDQVAVGVDPVMMLEGPVPATRRILQRNGLAVSEIDRYEINEAFAAVLCMWQRELDADPDTVNVNGGAIALGHPLGASGARLITTLVHELTRSGADRGVVSMCCRGGLGTATLVQRLT